MNRSASFPRWLLSAWLAMCATSAVAADDWNTFKHDNTRVGRTSAELAAPLAQRWVYRAPAAPQLAWPGPGGKTVEGLKLEHRVRFDDVLHVVAAEGNAYFGSSVDNCVYSVDVAAGKMRWRFVTGAPVRLAPTLSAGRIYVGSDDGYAYCLDAQSGELIWKLRAGPSDERILARGRMASRWPIRTGILVDGETAYFGAGIFPHESVHLIAVDAATGKILWKNDRISQHDAGRSDLTPQGYLLATDQYLFVPSGRTLPAAFDRATGEMIHKQRGGGKQVGGWQALLSGDKLLSVAEHHILALNQKSGNIADRVRGRQMTLDGDIAYLATGKEIASIDQPRFAAFKTERSKLEAAYAGLDRTLRRHPALVQGEKVRRIQANLAAARKELAQADEQNPAPTPEQRAALEAAVAEYETALAEASGKYRAALASYKKGKTKLEAIKAKQDALSDDAVRWRIASPHESTLIFAGGTVVVGGIGEVIAIDDKSGKQVWSTKVDGEARGLAVAGHHLFVSTTTGKIYAFADATAKVDKARVLGTPSNESPYPADGLTKRYAAAADDIVQHSGIRRGYCLVVGSEQGRLAYELAKRTELSIYCVESNAKKVAQARAALAGTGYYGTRITIDHADLAVLPHPNYFANLVVSDTLLLTGRMPGDPTQVAQRVKPVGGVICLGVPETAPDRVKATAQAVVASWLDETKLEEEQAQRSRSGGWTLLTRGALPDADSWSHQYGNSANTSSNEDKRVRGGLSVLWYGDPGPSAMLNRHIGAVGPVSAGGRMFVQGDESLMAYDSYNGQFLWEVKNPGALRTGVFNNFEPGNLVATDDSVFMVIGQRCLQLNAATGKVERIYTVPDADQDEARQWGYLAFNDGLLYGTSTIRKLIAEESRRRGRPTSAINSDQVFAYNTKTGQQAWTYQGQSISHTTVAVGDGHVFFIDSTITPEERERILNADKSELTKLTGEARKIAEDRQKRIDVRRTVSLDAKTGKLKWSKAVDVTDCSGVGIGAGQLMLMYQSGHVVVCGANANGHYWKQFLAGEFKRRRLVSLSADSGEKVWARDANYRHRPIIVGNDIIAEPWAYNLYTGQQKMRTHPLTGMPTPWKFARPGHHCGAISATPNMMFFRSRFTAYYDLEADSGTRHFAGHRLGCWINTIPAGGVVMIPEASAGCACLFSLTSTIVFEPREKRQVWGVYSAEGVQTPVRHMAINLGAPGDRRDAHGKLWLAYPRPSSRAGIDLDFSLKPNFHRGGKFHAHNAQAYKAQGDPAWLYASAAAGLQSCRLPLGAKGEAAGNYTVRLYFAAPEGDQPGSRVFDVKLQGKRVAQGVDIAKQAGGTKQALVLEYEKIAADGDLLIELLPASAESSEKQLPLLNGIEVLRENTKEIVE